MQQKIEKDFLTKAELAEKYGISKRTVETRIKGIIEQISKGRYNRYVIIEDSKLKINEYAFLDYCKYKKLLENPMLAKMVPPFEPALLKEIMKVQYQSA